MDWRRATDKKVTEGFRVFGVVQLSDCFSLQKYFEITSKVIELATGKDFLCLMCPSTPVF